MAPSSVVGAAAAASTTASLARTRRPARLHSTGSFHAGAPIPSIGPYEDGPPPSRQRRRSSLTSSLRRQSSGAAQQEGYHTFPTPPPKTPLGPSDPMFQHQQRAAQDQAVDDESSEAAADSDEGEESEGEDDEDTNVAATPLPLKQLGLLALLSLAEQTALNSIQPYIPTMVSSFPEIPTDQTGLYVGLVASVFALSQLATNLLWGALCDRVGRKPVMLLGTSLLAACFALFGFCTRYWQVIVVHAAMGLLNGNAAVVPTVLGELTDRSNQSRAFTWLPLMYSIGGITGPALGGLLVKDDRGRDVDGGGDGDGEVGMSGFRFLAPNVASAALLVFAVVVLAVWFEETLDEADRSSSLFPGVELGWLERLWDRWRSWCCCGRSRKQRRQSWSSRWPRTTSWQQSVLPPVYDEDDDDDDDDGEEEEEDGGEDEIDGAAQGVVVGKGPSSRGGVDGNVVDEEETLLGSPGRGGSAKIAPRPGRRRNGRKAASSKNSVFRQLLNRTIVILLSTYLVFQLCNISFNGLYPIFASAPPPTGRDMSPETIGLLLSFAGFMTIAFQIVAFQPLKARLGNLGTYRVALLGLAVSLALMPWAGSEDDEPLFGVGTGQGWLYTELAAVLVVKNVCAVGGLSSVMLLITNSAPSTETLGTLNGIAQTLSAAGRSVGPFLSGGLFTASTRVPRGELLAFGLFAGIALAGWCGTMMIRGHGLESEDWIGDHDDHEDQEQEQEGDEERGIRQRRAEP